MNRRNLVKDVLWVLVTIGFVAGIVRFTRGLGATTNLNDSTPWGFWIGFDVIAGVALAAGGFTLAATVYIFHLEKYRPILRPAILTAFLGYIAVIVGLLADLGAPWNIWRPVVDWQHHSVLFEVAWCVMLYTTVLSLEFLPVALEHRLFQNRLFQTIAHWVKRLTLPIVILGIVLSTLHQSSLGSLLLIMPARVHELWYSPILPVIFFVSAAALGLMMVTLEGFASAFVFRHEIKLELYSGLGKAAAVILWVLLAIRVGDLALRGVLPGAIDGSWQSVLFLVEISISTLIPAILLSIPASRKSTLGIGTASILTVFGMILHRLSASVIAVQRAPGMSYFPSWVEFAISIGIVSGIMLVFLFLTENLEVFGPELMHDEDKISRYDMPRFDSTTKVRFGESFRDTVIRRSAVLVGVVALTITFMPGRAWTTQAQSATVMAAQGWNVLRIDGNHSGDFVNFDHQAHQDRLSKLIPTVYATERDMCVECHHLSKPENGGPTACAECHNDMYQTTSIFNHSLHQANVAPGGNQSCAVCHQGGHSASTAVACVQCHSEMGPAKDGTAFSYIAPSYKDAMHGLCIGCHEQEAQKLGKPEIAYCGECHNQQ